MNKDQGMMRNQRQAHARDRRSLGMIIEVVAVLSLALATAPAWPSTPAKPWRAAESTGSSAALKFSTQPRDEEFLHTGLFTEPLAPVAKTTAAENQDLAGALLAYREELRSASGNDEAVGPLVGYLSTHQSARHGSRRSN
jgi:hypothetical protein